jgi:hypothetical protein
VALALFSQLLEKSSDIMDIKQALQSPSGLGVRLQHREGAQRQARLFFTPGKVHGRRQEINAPHTSSPSGVSFGCTRVCERLGAEVLLPYKERGEALTFVEGRSRVHTVSGQ